MGFFEKCFLKHLYESSFVSVCYKTEKFALLHLIKLLIKIAYFPSWKSQKKNNRSDSSHGLRVLSITCLLYLFNFFLKKY